MSDEADDYVPPAGNLIQFNLNGEYIPPQGNLVYFDLGTDGSIDPPVKDDQYIYPQSFDSAAFGVANLRTSYRFISTTGIASKLSFGTAKIYNYNQYLKPSGSNFTAFGTASVVNVRRPLSPNGINTNAFGTAKVENYKRYITANGISTLVFGAPWLLGGVSYLKPGGIAAPAISTAHSIRDPKYPQTIKPSGISSAVFGKPELFPKFIFAKGFSTAQYGSPFIQRSPMPAGFDTSYYGTPWVSHYTRTVSPHSIDAPLFEAFPTVIFRNRKIYVNSERDSITVFGDVAVRNTRRFIAVEGIDSLSMSGWHLVETNRRLLNVKGINADNLTGTPAVQNVKAGIRALGFDASLFGANTHTRVEHWHRSIAQKSFDSAVIGRATVQLAAASVHPSGFAGEIGAATVSHWLRSLNTSGLAHQLFGMTTVWYKRRAAQLEGFDNLSIGNPVLTHFVRRIQINTGITPTAAGTPRVSFARQYIQPVWDDEVYSSNHKVGGTQHISVLGFDAARFGTRIIPESQSLFSKGFTAECGTPDVSLHKRYIQVRSFGNIGDADYQRWGKQSQVYNLRQYIEQYRIIESGLEPLQPSSGNLVLNRNRRIQVYGFDAYKPMTTTEVYNNARLIQPAGWDSFTHGQKTFIADRIRKITPEPIEAPLAGKWLVVWTNARVIQPVSIAAAQVGQPKLENTRRNFRWIGGMETAEYGVPMIDFAIRTLSFNPRYTIAPPVLPLPVVKLWTRYVEAYGIDHAQYGLPELRIHWNIIKPKWVHKDYFGMPELRNVTPELHFRGPEFLEIGKPKIELLKRFVNVVDGFKSEQFGKPIIADRKQHIQVHGIGAPEFSKLHRVKKTTSPPYSLQHIWLDEVTNEESDEEKGHFGIKPPDIGRPSVRSNSLIASGFNSMKFGEASVQSNGIMVQYGIFDDVLQFGTPSVSNKHRIISVEGISNEIVVGTPSFSPHTIYAVVEAPAQAIANHGAKGLHKVGESGGSSYYRDGSMVMGVPRVHMQNNQLIANSFTHAAVGTPSIKLRKQYIDCQGFNSMRMGFHKIGDGKQFIEFFNSNDYAEFGTAVLSKPLEKNRKVFVETMQMLQIGKPMVDFFHRQVKPTGINSLSMGNSRGSVDEYMPQSLHVGYRKPCLPSGFDAARYGNAWISLRVRDIQAAGFDSFTMEYDVTQFAKRMRVTKSEVPRPVQIIAPVGFDTAAFSAFNIRPGVHYIRPDGNADQFRKGAF